MRKVISLFVTFVVLLSGMTSANSADNGSNDPAQLMENSKPASGARGIVFVENASSVSPIGYLRYSHIPTFKSNGSIAPSDYWNWRKCTSWSDTNCPIKVGYQMEGRLFLGTCLNSEEIGCIESFSVFDRSGSAKKLTLMNKSFGATADIPEDIKLGIPRSSSPNVYQDSDGNLFLVRATLLVIVSGTDEPFYKFDADITPVSRNIDSSLSVPRVESITDSRTGLGLVFVSSGKQGCLSADAGICYQARFSELKNKYSLSVRVPRAVSGWLRGRVADADFDAQALNDRSQKITITANSVRLPIAGGWVDYSQLPVGFIEKVWPSGGYDSNPNSSYFLVADPSQGDQGLEEYEAWSPYLKEKALTTVSNWSFGTNFSNSGQSCLKASGKISGFVASNASVYSSKPPEWDAATSSLTYKVAAPHLDELGNVNQGTYTLAMPLKSIKCLYGQSNLPPSATVSIAYGSEVKTVATVSLKSDSGWIFFAANGFHYSNPTIVVKFNKSKSALTGKAAPKPLKSSAAQSPLATKSIWCSKGTITRKVIATKPKCPKGFKMIANPKAG
jgi:hypothetical protein